MERYQDVQLLRLLGRQLDEEVRQYAADLRAGLIEDSGKRKSKKSDVRVDYNDLRNRVQLMEPNKDDREVAAMVQRAFGIKSHEEAFRLCFDDVSDADMREPPPQPVEHILMRLDIAGLLRRTSPHTPAALDTSDGADSHLGVATMPPDTGKAPSPATRPVAAGGRVFQINEQEAPQDIVDKRNQAVETHLASIEAMQVPKWAAVKASTSGSKGQSDDGSEQEADQSFLSLLIARFANRAAAPPEAKIE